MIDFVHRRAIRRALIAAFATYFVTFAAYALLLRSWPLVEALAGDHGARASEPTRPGWTVAAVVSIGCVLAIVTQLTRMFAPREVAETPDRRPHEPDPGAALEAVVASADPAASAAGGSWGSRKIYRRPFFTWQDAARSRVQ